MMHAFHILVYSVIGNDIRDTQCGFKLFTRSAAFEMFRNQRLRRWCFDVELIYIAQKMKIPLQEVEI